MNMRTAVMPLILILAVRPAPAAAQAGDEPIPDSVAHPIVLACGDRLDPPAFVRAYVPDLSDEATATLAALEAELRRANASLGRRWHMEDLDQEARAEILMGLRANYQQWWTRAQPVLGPTRVEALMAGSAAPDSTPAEARCPFRSAIGVIGLVPMDVGPGEAMAANVGTLPTWISGDS